jgi:hypothetical protein
MIAYLVAPHVIRAVIGVLLAACLGYLVYVLVPVLVN